MTGLIAYANSYPNKVLPGLSLGGVPVGGMTDVELKEYLQQMNDKLVQDGLHFSIETPEGKDTNFVMYPVVVTETNSVELLTIDIDKEVDRLVGYGKQGNLFSRAGAVLQSRLHEPQFRLIYIHAEDQRIEETLAAHIEQFEQQPANANIVITQVAPLLYEFTTSSVGVVYEYGQVVDQLIDAWSMLEVPDIELIPNKEDPEITLVDAQKAALGLERILNGRVLTLKYTTPSGNEKNWSITSYTFHEWIEVKKEEEEDPKIGLNIDKTSAFIEEIIAPNIEVEAQDAKFEVGPNGKVVQFQGSRPGITMLRAKTIQDIEEALRARVEHNEGVPTTVVITTEQAEPLVKTGEINDLGITEVLGEGVSSYAGSPSNRVKNIRNAVQKLNGVIVKPGEEFSTIDHTQPYTLDGGYLPELVIKGDEIKPEIGGGLCQIGTTLFRMAMNSGMEITQRRNHSLVVHYYNDPSNGLPGTDATIYDPAPDFRFLNDTGHHILVQTRMNEGTQDLIFELWGTSDGRAGAYTAPVVKRWIPHEETKEIKTTKLEPGARECQHAYTGADASFTYSRILPDGTTQERLFESHYRPLPEICLVGVIPEELACEEEGGCEPEVVDDDGTGEQLIEDIKNDQLIILE